MNPNRGDKKSLNRQEVKKEYYEGEANKNWHDNYFGTYKGSKTREQLNKDLDDDWDRLMTKYAEATLKDLKMKPSKEAIDYLVEKYKLETKILNGEADKNPTVENQNLLDSSDSARSRDAATLGLKALKKMGRDPGEIDDDNREWFLYEDQTIGLPMVADLVSQGKSRQTIKSLVEYVDKTTDKDSSKIYDHGYWELSDLIYANKTGDLDKYIDACQEVVKDKDWKN